MIECPHCNARYMSNTVLENHIEWFHESGEDERRNFFEATEEVVVDEETGGMKGRKDVQLHAIPAETLAELGRVYAYGASKYEDYNFRRGYEWSLSFDALQRHLWSFWSGEDYDPESKLHHLAHAAWHCLSLLFWSIRGKGKDDRPRH